uniref:NADH-ubiquinone oxidoreductase chain 3 n=2 Tax=Pomacea TaxID=72702 RepID=A0A411ADI3_9CAEN|nr:NADH dehydrogenase subunit 3 [Pomacea bridgesi]YP_009563678.1 NADH dehydrogenase subunit 3 [Pomacea diffusa]ART65951.1 NADH dehydrogenase subunit 3 [Pomacea bridgesi]QAX27151.1 NADH dehydrogenase subunit 3 [Pomacea diffusa]
MMSSLLSSLVACFLSSVVMCLGWFLAKRGIMDREKSSAFECGFDPIKSARSPFSLRFFLLAIIFLIFDVEIVLLFPVLSSIGFSFSLSTSFGVNIFLLVLMAGLFYEWKEGSLDWAQ